MKKKKKIFALLLSFVMIMGMAVTANAATSVSTTQDQKVMVMSSSEGTVSYNATTVSGGEEDVTRYSYFIMMPEGGSTSSVPVSITMGSSYPVLTIDGQKVTENGKYEKTLNFSSGTKTFVASSTDGKKVREFKVTAGVKGEDLETVYVRIDVRNAVEWLKDNASNSKAETVKTKMNAITSKAAATQYKIGSDGIMTAYVPVNLKAGSTAMDALNAACSTLKLTTKGSSTYVSGIGSDNTYLGEFDTTNMSGWMYLAKTSASGAFTTPNYGAAGYNLVGGEYFAWIFVNGWSSDQTGYVK